MVTADGAVACRTEDPMKLSDIQLVVLSAAAQREDHGIELPQKLRGGAAQKFAAKLLREVWSKRCGRAAFCRCGGATMRTVRWRCA